MTQDVEDWIVSADFASELRANGSREKFESLPEGPEEMDPETTGVTRTV